MSILTYLILFIVAGYLFKVNPVICVALVGAVAFFKIRGFFGGRRNYARASGNAPSEAAVVALCITLLERSERMEQQSPTFTTDSRSPEEDPLEGLFLD